ncbi:hypothetical protein SKAU_G00013730 [Synaphobranchus kaupii]|uniref:Reverse transcriptase zinc-binding domain-containing protein n=1 Tax=Synaphobranchus kaupii TaxID=118154 RepID=A0A9Q1JD79_SYNKA|nr:hypothetical protein SKAU_G00013730 [Synaphobranchus kaupii]
MYKRHLALTERCLHGYTDSEHVYHLFWECSVARRVWGLVVSSVSQNRLLPRSSLTAESVLYGPRGGCKTPELQRQWRIVNTIKQVLWEARNIRVYQKTSQEEDTEPSPGRRYGGLCKGQASGEREMGGGPLEGIDYHLVHPPSNRKTEKTATNIMAHPITRELVFIIHFNVL